MFYVGVVAISTEGTKYVDNINGVGVCSWLTSKDASVVSTSDARADYNDGRACVCAP